MSTAKDTRSAARLARLPNGSMAALAQAADLLTAFAQRSQARYLDELLRLKCGPDLLALGIFPNAKELTESFGAYNAVRAHLPAFSLDDPGVRMVAVGDGVSPRTGATFAFRSAWECVSVDPKMRPWSGAVRRLAALPLPIEQVRVSGKRVVVVAVHSHAHLQASIDACVDAEEIAVVAIPCCVPLALGEPPDVEQEDFAISSPERTVRVWRSVAHLRTRRPA